MVLALGQPDHVWVLKLEKPRPTLVRLAYVSSHPGVPQKGNWKTAGICAAQSVADLMQQASWSRWVPEHVASVGSRFSRHSLTVVRALQWRLATLRSQSVEENAAVLRFRDTRGLVRVVTFPVLARNTQDDLRLSAKSCIGCIKGVPVKCH